MSAMLRTAAAMFFGLAVSSSALAAPALREILELSDWDQPAASAPTPADQAELTETVQLVSNSEPAKAATDNSCSDCLDCADDVCGCGDTCGGSCGPMWYASVGAVILERDDPSPGTIGAANPAGTPFHTAQDFDFEYEAGLDVSLARRFSGGSIVEGRYFGVDPTADHAFITPGNFIGGGFTGPGGTLIRGHYLTKLDSTEINLRRSVGDRLSLLGGFRWIELKDEVTYNIGPAARGNYEFNNHLYGGQIGANLNVAPAQTRWLANLETKAGVYTNHSDGGINEFSGNTFIGGFNGRAERTAFVGEIGLNVGYRLTEHVVLRSGYQLLWLDQVALASDAASRSLVNPALLTNVDDTSGLFYHGATTGIDFAW